MSALISNGYSWLKPLLDLRINMIENRNKEENRSSHRRNGQLAVNGMGVYKFGYRIKLLRQLLEIQKKIQKVKPHVKLISNQELIAIQTMWYRDLLFDKKVSDIYNAIYHKDLQMPEQNEKMLKEIDLLKEVCTKKPENFALIQELLILQKNKSLLIRKRGLKDDMERVIEKYAC